MLAFTWTAGEKKLARSVFDKDVRSELAEFISQFKAKADAVQNVKSIWIIRDWLDKREREIDAEYDFRYSQLIRVFANLVRTGRLDLSELAGLSEGKIMAIKQISEI